MSVLTVRLSTRMEQLGSHWTDFNKIWCLKIFFENMSEKIWSFIEIWEE